MNDVSTSFADKTKTNISANRNNTKKSVSIILN